MEKEKRSIAQAARAEQAGEASAIPLLSDYLWAQLAMRHYIKGRTMKKRLTGVQGSFSKSTIDTCDTDFRMQAVADEEETEYR